MPTLDGSFNMNYPDGTRTASSTTLIHESELLRPGSIWAGIMDALDAFLEEHGETIPREDLFITIGFSTTEMLVEVSDRLQIPTSSD